MQKFENVSTAYDNKMAGNTQEQSRLQNKIDLAEAQGKSVNKAYYDGLMKEEQKNQNILKQKRAALQKQLKYAVASGEIKKGSDEWYSMTNQIYETEQAINQATIAMQEYANAKRQIDWDNFDKMMESMKRVNAEADYYIKLMSNDKLIDDNGNFTDAGNATMALNYANAEQYKKEAQKYLDEYNRILKSGDTSEDAIKRMHELQDAYWDCKLAAEGELDAIKDLMREGYDKELDYLGELIKKYRDLRSSGKEFYDYQLNIQKQVKNISNLQKQLQVWGSNDTEEAKAKIQQLKIDLESAESELQETEYERFISETDKMLDDMLSEYEEFIDTKLENIDDVLESMFAELGAGGSIVNTLKELDANLSSAIINLIGDNFGKKEIENHYSEAPRYGGYAKGSRHITKDQLAWTQENGAEIIFRKSDDAMLTPLGQGDMVFTSEQSERLWELSQGMSLIPNSVINMNTPDYSKIAPVNRSMGDVNVTFSGDMNLPGITDSAEFANSVEQVMRDAMCSGGRTQKCIAESVASQMYGKGVGSANMWRR